MDRSVKIESMNNEQNGELARRARVHAALGDVHRLMVVDLLATTDASSSELGASLGMASNLLAHHLKTLEDAGLITRRRSEGDGRRTYLSQNRHDGWLVPDAVSGLPLPTARRVVFVCTANTARSHLAAAAWRRISAVSASSAGTHPGERVHPGAVAAARRHGLDLPETAPRALSDVDGAHDLIVTVCDRAHEELGGRDWAHWAIPDPVPAGNDGAFDDAYQAIARRVERLAGQVAGRSDAGP
jgi:ArsR family transcriptional regulator, arsenate/arsenite/antimonite-responsive transcriptional repressor / arsenate reductase (thioredoxin)